MSSSERRLLTELETRAEELAEAQRIAKLGFWRWNVLSNEFFWSDEIYRLLGRDPETFAVSVESTFACIHPEDRDETMARMLATIAERKPQSHHYRTLGTDGQVLHFWSNTRLVLDEKGEPIEVRGTCQDVTERVRFEAALRESEDHYRNMVELNPQIPWTADPNGNILEMGPRWFELVGMTQFQALGQGWSEALHPEDYARAYSAWRQALATGEPLDVEYRIRLRDGTYNWMRDQGAARRGENGEIIRWYGTVEDIQKEKTAQLALLESQARLSSVLESTSDGVILVDRRWVVTYFNRRASEALCEVSELSLGTNIWEAFPEQIGSDWHQVLLEAAATHRATTAEVHSPRLGMWLEVHAFPTSDGLSIFFRDITEVRRAREEVEHLAHHDGLTGLPNRTRFVQCLDEALEAVVEAGTGLALIYLDLDDFKDINDTFGHDAGDAVLTAVGRRLEQTVSDGAVVARFGGDEFAILLTHHFEETDLEQVASAIQTALMEPLDFRGAALSCKASLGIAIYPTSDPCPSELMKNADLALYQAKRSGGNQHAFFNPEVRQIVQRRVSALSCAREALARDAIIPFYQPKVSMETGKVCGFEALLRWTGPKGGLYSPGLIKEAFEDPVLSLELGRRMLHRVVQDMRGWREAGLEFGHVALNVSAQEFVRADVASNVIGALREAGLPASTLEIEVTETVFLGDGSGGVADALQTLHDCGVSIALDDFGTGYASLTHLSKFPVSWLKIDQSFVRDMGESPDATAIVRAVIGLSHSLGVQVVAEGVETIQQWKQLKRRGCDLVQGYLIAKPMSADRVPYFLKTWDGIEGRHAKEELMAH